ncbi:MAG: phosphoribosyltransferase family protein [Myxococcales bacterium]
MITDLVRADFWAPPDDLTFESRFGDLLKDAELTAQFCLDPRAPRAELVHAATQLYIRLQAIPSVLLNYKICIDFGLPLHPTQYIDFVKFEKNPDAYMPSTRKVAQELFVESIDIARSVYRLKPIAPMRLAGLRARIPEFLTGFLYTNTADKYTWRASEPLAIRALAEKVKKSGFVPDLIVGAAHGSIRPALMLAELLDCELYFLRFSMFKRDDEQPIRSASDEVYLERFRDKKVMVFDEDVAKGRTLKAFATCFQGQAAELRSASVLRHYLAPFDPDFVGEVFYDDD